MTVDGKPWLLNKRIRPVRREDLPSIKRFAEGSSLGLTSLPRNDALLMKKIELSIDSFQKQVSVPTAEKYLFILEEIDSHQAIGCCGIDACAGWYDPLFYLKETSVHLSKSKLGIEKDLTLLKPVSDSPGQSSLCSLYLDKQHRKGGVGRLLSLSRFFYVATSPERFTESITAELRGVINPDGSCPFYDAVLRPIIHLPFEEAITHYSENKRSITNLIPELEIYKELLPEEIQDLIKKVHPSTQPAYQMLTKEGFSKTNFVDLFDAGPQVACEKHKILTVERIQEKTIKSLTEDKGTPPYHLVGNMGAEPRVAYGIVEDLGGGEITLNQKCAKMLEVSIGDRVGIRF